ncbi:hypothetical protein J2Z32_000428 [Paenibacillus turicensis]|uniref:UPF0311 protein J2Z32_000428 n=2 Tax=Paenibacillus turicensis TaxID=160487 RepID=A0ABS4FML4_9BACL|nr:hypothetical protein [Paenibacillus turicensis]
MMLEAELVLELEVELGQTQEVGETPKGFLRLIPITGGTFSGPNIKGNILSGGYDWNTTRHDQTAHAFAKYALQTDDGVVISVENEGILPSESELSQTSQTNQTSQSVHSSMIKTTTRFEVADGKYEWLRSGVFVGSLEAGAGISGSASATEKPSVCIKIYKLK